MNPISDAHWDAFVLEDLAQHAEEWLRPPLFLPYSLDRLRTALTNGAQALRRGIP